MINLRIFRSPDMGDVGGGAAETPSPESSSTVEVSSPDQATEGKQDSSEGSEAQPQKPAKSEALRLSELKARIEKDPSYKFSEEDHDLIEKESLGQIKDEAETESKAKEGENKTDEKANSPIQDALKEVGAKNEAELVAKIKDLKKFISGRDSQAYAALDKQHKELAAKAANHQQWLSDLAQGKAEAIQYLQTLTGQHTINQLQNGEAVFDPDEFISPEAGAKANKAFQAMLAQNKALEAQLDEIKGLTKETSEFYKQQSEKAQIEAARAQVESDRSSIKAELASIAEMSEFRNILKPTSGTIYQLLDEYWKGNEGDPIDPRIQPIVDVIENARLINGLAPKEALLRGAKLVAFGKQTEAKTQVKHQPSINIPSAGAKQTVNNYTENDVKAMMQNPEKIPSSWMDKDGDLIIDKIPANLRQFVV